MIPALLIIDHGSKVNTANLMLENVAALLREKRPNLIIEIAHMELASPTIQDGINLCISKGATHITAHPYMLSPGRHATKDIPDLVQEALAQHPHITHTITDPLGIHSKIADIILERSAL